MSKSTMALALIVIAVFFLGISQAEEVTPELSQERVIFHTNLGDIVLALFPTVAPKHVEQILKMTRAGVYNGMAFYRLEKGFVLQIENYDTRKTPVTEAQRATVQKIPAEFGTIKHHRGILSMARYDDPNSAEASFSILLGDAPHLDGQYTVFGKVDRGMEVVDAIEQIPVVTGGSTPLVDLFVQSAEVVNADDLAKMQLRGVQEIALPSEQGKAIFEILAGLAFFLTVATPVVKAVIAKPPPQKKSG